MVWEILLDSVRNAVLISGLVVIMMMMIESLSLDKGGRLLGKLRGSSPLQVVISSILGVIPGCMGGFASVSMYTHGLISFGALVAMMIASSGDEAFVMLAMFPEQAGWLFAALLGIAVVTGIVVDLVVRRSPLEHGCDVECSLHDEPEGHHHHHHEGRHFTWHRAVMFIGVALFIAALVTGSLEHEEDAEEITGTINLLGEEWMYWMFGVLSLAVLAVLIFAEDHFVEEHLWHHIVVRHLPSVFHWSLWVLAAVGFALHYLDIASWISSNTALMIVLATFVGIIPESGPHLVFVTLYASGIVPLPVLLASCISQDGHASLPLLAESKRSYLLAKLVNCIVALAVAFGVYLIRR